MTVTVNLTNVSISTYESRVMFSLFVDGKYVKFGTITRETLSDEWLTNYFQKWAYRTYKIENAHIVLVESEEA